MRAPARSTSEEKPSAGARRRSTYEHAIARPTTANSRSDPARRFMRRGRTVGPSAAQRVLDDGVVAQRGVLGDLVEELVEVVGTGPVGDGSRDGREGVVLGRERRVIRGRLARHDLVDDRGQPLLLFLDGLLVSLEELGQDLAAEQLEALHDVLVLVLARLAHEDDLVDATLLVPEQELSDLLGRAHRAAEAAEAALHDLGPEAVGVRRRRVHGAGVEALLAPLALVLRPHVGDTGLVATEDVVVRE